MPASDRFLHGSLAVTDLDRAREFYARLLGFPEVGRPPFARPSIRYEKDPDGDLAGFVGPLPPEKTR